jgi:Ala-tRNA(Pro) deacylase
MFAEVVMATPNGDLMMLVLPAPSVVDFANSEVVGEQVRLASESEFATAFSDCEAGAMPPSGNLYDLPVYVDLTLGQNERIVFQAGRTA